MSNPAVIRLASLQEIADFPYRFEIEDNIGEAIHIHFRDMRIDLTVEEFQQLANKMREIFVDLVENEKFHIEEYDAGNLVQLVRLLIDLKDIIRDEVYLEDILVDTYTEAGEPIYLPLPNSRVVKALAGMSDENDSRRQINYYKPGSCELQTNQERIAYNLQQIKTYGYPNSDELILLRADNTIIDGQHRAACLFYLYGNIRVPVRKLLFTGEGENVINTRKDMVLSCQEENQRLRVKNLKLEQQYHALDVLLNERDRIIENYQKEQKKRETDIECLDKILKKKDEIIAEYQKDQIEREADIRSLDAVINKKDEIIVDYQTEVTQKDKVIVDCQIAMKQKDEILSSYVKCSGGGALLEKEGSVETGG